MEIKPDSPKNLQNGGRPISQGARIGHVHLKVANIERALGFYCGVLGFELIARFGQEAAFISAGGYHHHIGLNTWESRGGPPPPPGTTGLYHLAILYPTRADLSDAFRRVIGAGIQLDGASDHGVSEALYLRDPDENGVELCWDRPREQWPHLPDGRLQIFTKALDIDGLLAETQGMSESP
jgi:catechol 2,3-dioxygenase